MYQYFIYFIVALIIYSTHEPLDIPIGNPLVNLAGGALLLFVYTAISRYVYGSILRHLKAGTRSPAVLHKKYLSWNTRLTVGGLIFFALTLYLFNIKYYLLRIPLFRSFESLSDLAGLSVFILYLVIQWSLSYPPAQDFFAGNVSLARFVTNRLRLALSVLFPWFVVSLLFDFIGTSTFPVLKSLNPFTQELILFGVFLFVLVLLAPLFMRFFWGLKSMPPGEERSIIERACSTFRLSYRDIVLWQMLEGEVITAGIMGLVGRFRYLMISPGLLRILNPDELEAVVGHEVGHIRKWHLVYYVLFLLGYAVLVYPSFDLIYLLVLGSGFVYDLMDMAPGYQVTILSIVITMPVLALFILYFRFIFGFFIRNFERQADLFSLREIGSSEPLIGALEKIGFHSGNIRDVPSWHHFSIAQRVTMLLRGERNPELIVRHDRRVRFGLVVCFLLIGAAAFAGYSLSSSGLARNLNHETIRKILARHVEKNPLDEAALTALSTLDFEAKRYREAEKGYLRVLQLNPRNAEVLNNLAWLYATCPDPAFRHPAEALKLAEDAAALSGVPHILDTLAESYFVNGMMEEAAETERKALAMKPDDPGHYREQLRKFENALRSGPPGDRPGSAAGGNGS